EHRDDRRPAVRRVQPRPGAVLHGARPRPVWRGGPRAHAPHRDFGAAVRSHRDRLETRADRTARPLSPQAAPSLAPPIGVLAVQQVVQAIAHAVAHLFLHLFALLLHLLADLVLARIDLLL